MKKVLMMLASLSLLASAPLARADRDRDESGHGSHKYERRVHKGGEYKEEYWDGRCKVERKWKRNGEFKEERKCEAPQRVVRERVVRERVVVHEHHHHHEDRHARPAVEPTVVINVPPIVIR